MTPKTVKHKFTEYLVFNATSKKDYKDAMAIIANCSSIPHDPNEIDRLDPLSSSIPYDWSLKHR